MTDKKSRFATAKMPILQKEFRVIGKAGKVTFSIILRQRQLPYARKHLTKIISKLPEWSFIVEGPVELDIIAIHELGQIEEWAI